MSRRSTPNWGGGPPERLEQRISIERDGTVVARSGKVEYGQGIRTGFASIVANELGLPMEKVRVELGETDRVPWDMGTFGSLSTATDGAILRAAAAIARRLLVERAGVLFGLPVSNIRIEDGQVLAGDGRSVTFAELTADLPLTGPVPDTPTEPRRSPPFVSASTARIEGLAIVRGRALYPADVRLPGMVRGHALHPPKSGAQLVSIDEGRAFEMTGVIGVIRDGDFVGVVAERDEQALAAVSALQAIWSPAEARPANDVNVVLRRDKGVESALGRGSIRLTAQYHVPHIAHASIGPSAAVAEVRGDGVDLYVATQRPFALRDEVAELLGLAAEQVRVHPQMMGGMYGRGNVADVAVEAVLMSRAIKRPVLVQWTRAEEFRLSPHRPALEATLSGALDSTGKLTAWRYDARTNPHTYGEGMSSPRLVEITSGRNALPPYQLGRAEVLLNVTPAAIRTGAFRSLAAAPHVFAIESFVDELAHAGEVDPIEFRLRHIEDARLRRVLETVRDSSNWKRRQRRSGHGFGVACAVYNGTYIAEVAEVAVDPPGSLRLRAVWCAVDAGYLVNPDGARNQIEGGIQQAASWTLFEALHEKHGQVETASWGDYRIARFKDAPKLISVTFIDQSEIESSGIGEPGSVPTAAAIGNAVFDACGRRLRRLPLSEALSA